MPRVLVPDPIAPAGLQLLRDHPDIDLSYHPGLDEDDFLEEFALAEGVLIRTRVLSAEMMQAAPNLRLISRHGVGYDNLPAKVLQELGIGLAITADANAPSVAEHALMFMLAASRRLVAADTLVRDGRWAERGAVQGRDLMGARVTLLGFGRIGRAVAARLLPFGALVTVFDPVMPPDLALPDTMRRADSLEDGLQGAQILSLHAPPSPDGPLIGAAEIAQLAPGAILINTARGSLVDEAAVLAALESGHLDRYAADVFATEPPAPDDPLPQHDHVIATPHNSAITVEGAERMAIRAAQNLIDGLTGTLDRDMTVLPINRGGG